MDPYQFDGTYWNGDHNGGFYNQFNYNSYGYCYENPVRLIDPNGKQVDVNGGTLETVVVHPKKHGGFWRSFGKALLITAVVAAVVVAAVVTVGTALVAYGVVSSSTMATVGTVAGVVGGGLLIGEAIETSYELGTHKDAQTGENLSDEELGKRAGEFTGSLVGGAVGAVGGSKLAKPLPTNAGAFNELNLALEEFIATEVAPLSKNGQKAYSTIVAG